MLSGHEHFSFGQSNSIDNNKNVQFVQGNALYGCAGEGNGFCAITTDMDNYYIEGYSFMWKNSIYVPEKIIDAKVRRQVYGNIEIKDDYYKQIAYDSYKIYMMTLEPQTGNRIMIISILNHVTYLQRFPHY